ncbi:Response regulator PleD [Novipirellula galeiformis]|uniref:diguanylate cyclase n=1 Tax=Novipirellula galeiformis TaxID=2528004 RepID=A0A5C6CG38_9BACT|nr:sensor domain-containing diguanylate cyclase [Novipirellula galeiformis]TWU22206.1 Response regulator PleD [Novipirellula galeiformis]
MLRIYFASLRIAIAIVCVGISLILGSKFLGLIPASIHDNGRAIFQLVAFFIVGGVAAYTLLVVRLFGSFEITQVVTDRVRQSLDALAEGLVITDEANRIVLANRSFCDTVGRSAEKLVGRKLDSLKWVCSRSATHEDFPWTRAMHTQTRLVDQLMRYQHPNGSYRFLAINASPIEATKADSGGVLATFRDVTAVEEHRAEVEQLLQMLRNSREEISNKNRELQLLATQDALTGCVNRRALLEQFDALWKTVNRVQPLLACLMVDNDHFKQVNDTYGHPVGDEVLKAVARILRESFSKPAVVCRYGGEEFCIVMPGVTLKEATQAGEVARQRVADQRFEEQPELQISVSIGVSHLQMGAEDAQSLINQADCALYVAKHQGRNQVVVYGDPEPKSVAPADENHVCI